MIDARPPLAPSARGFSGAPWPATIVLVALFSLLAGTPQITLADEPPLHPGEFFVRVVDANGRPTPLARVLVIVQTEEPTSAYDRPIWSASWTDSHGLARLARPEGFPFVIEVQPDDLPRKVLAQPDLPEGRTPLEVKLNVGVTLKLTVPAPGYGGDRSPPPAWGTLTLTERVPDGAVRSVLLDGKEAVFEGLVPGKYLATLQTHWADVARWSEPIEVTSELQQSVVLPRPVGRRLRGTVIYNGKPAKGGLVRFTGNLGGKLLTETLGKIEVSDDGKFEIELFDSYGVSLEYSPPDTDTFHHYKLYKVPEEGVSVTLTVDGKPVSGRLVDQHGAVLPGAVIELRYASIKHDTDGRVVRVEAGPDGSFSTPYLRMGLYQIVVKKGPNDLLSYGYTTISESKADIVLPRGRRVSLQGLGEDQSVRVWCDRGELLESFIDAGDVFAIPLETKTLYCVDSYPRQLGTAKIETEPKTEGQVALSVAMQPAAELEVRPWRTWISPDHTLELTPLQPENADALIVRGWNAWFVSKPGEYRLRWWRGKELLREETVTLQLDDDEVIDLED